MAEDDIGEVPNVLPEQSAVSEPTKEMNMAQKIIHSSYGPLYDGRLRKLKELIDFVPVYKEFYLQARRADPTVSAMKLIRQFNEENPNVNFWPYPAQYKSWRKKWDAQFLREQGFIEDQLHEARAVIVRNKVHGDITLQPTDDSLEEKSNRLGDILIEDAIRSLENDQQNEELFKSDELVKRKSHYLKVFSEITKKVQGKEGLRLRRSDAAVNAGNFLTSLMDRAKTGRMSQEELAQLTGSVAHAIAVNSPESQAHEKV